MRVDAIKGVVGVSSVTLGSIISHADIEYWLRVTSLVVGIAVGLVTIWSITRKSRKK